MNVKPKVSDLPHGSLWFMGATARRHVRRRAAIHGLQHRAAAAGAQDLSGATKVVLRRAVIFSGGRSHSHRGTPENRWMDALYTSWKIRT